VFTVSSAAQVAGVAALEDANHTNFVVEHTSKWRAWLTDALSALGLNVLPSYGNFVCVQFASAQAAEAADLALRQRGLIPRTLREYGLADCLRITIGLEVHCRAVVEVMSDLGGEG